MPTAPIPAEWFFSDPDFRPTSPLGWTSVWLPDVQVSHISMDPSLVMGEAPTPEPSPLPLTALERILVGLPLLNT